MVKLAIIKKKNESFARIVLILAVTVSLTIMILSTILYVNFENIGTYLIQSYMKDSLYQISYSSTVLSDSSKTLIVNLFLDKDMLKLRNSYNKDPQETVMALNKLKSYLAAANFIHSIYIYNKNTGIIYSNNTPNQASDINTFYDKEAVEYLKNPPKNNTFIPIPRRIPNPILQADAKQYSNVFTYIYIEEEGTERKFNSAIILNVYERNIRNIIESMDTEHGSGTFIIDRKGKITSSIHSDEILKDISSEKYIRRI